MKEKKHELQYMTWKEVEEAFDKDPVIFIPLGSMEQHGPQSITGDYIAAYEVAKLAALQSNSYCTPVIPFGYSEYFRGYPGTISLSPSTFHNLVKDVCISLIEHGITKIILVNGHGGNSNLLDILARDIRREHNLMIGKIDIWRALSPDFKQKLYGDKVKSLGHGGDPITSVMMYLRPDDIRMDLIKENDVKDKWGEFSINSVSLSKIQDIDIQLYFNMDEITQQGILGDPTISSKQIGEKIIDRLVEYCVEFSNKMKNTNTIIKNR